MGSGPRPLGSRDQRANESYSGDQPFQPLRQRVLKGAVHAQSSSARGCMRVYAHFLGVHRYEAWNRRWTSNIFVVLSTVFSPTEMSTCCARIVYRSI